MKQTFLVLLIGAGSLYTYGQSNTNPVILNEPNPQTVTPAYSAPCADNPPCYMYKVNDKRVMECPGRLGSGDIALEKEGTYMGNYPTTNPEDLIPYLKNDGKRIWLRPAYNESYTILQDPPCYIYKRHNLPVMECPGLRFGPEK